MFPWILFLLCGAIFTEGKNITDWSIPNPQNIKISIFSRRNETGQLFVQVKFEEDSPEYPNIKSSWEVDIDHNSRASGKKPGEVTTLAFIYR
ncbi:Hemolymph lipopolysaccharide-binding protein [Blattella germanica]|nr:Hemolymph lipopolysaccharide-binding protein [Blattella germanica]